MCNGTDYATCKRYAKGVGMVIASLSSRMFPQKRPVRPSEEGCPYDSVRFGSAPYRAAVGPVRTTARRGVPRMRCWWASGVLALYSHRMRTRSNNHASSRVSINTALSIWWGSPPPVGCADAVLEGVLDRDMSVVVTIGYLATYQIDS